MDPELNDAHRDTHTRSNGSWSNLFIMLAMAMGGWLSVLWVSDTKHHAYVAVLICQSILFGMATARLPAVSALLDRKKRGLR